ncbi:class I SAM-dependent methyltransferase [Kiloniella sp.]|uniref:class I SAM-dependent methyltransferase n=1 Tax=Kiloniella sp. TaxID=1938587 RepID=UPI003A8FAC71
MSGVSFDPSCCDLCDSAEAQVVVDWRAPSIMSDGHVIEADLRRVQCSCCGLIRNASHFSAEDCTSYYKNDYSLGKKAKEEEPILFSRGGAFKRSKIIGEWISEALVDFSVTQGCKVLEVGCGEGALMSELKESWRVVDFHGIDLSESAVSIAIDKGLAVECYDIDAQSGVFDLIYSVAVIEHTPSPSSFLQSMSERLKQNGRIVVIAPCQDHGNRDFLFWDHLYLFHSDHIICFAEKAGLKLSYCDTTHPMLSGFAMLVFEKEEQPDKGPVVYIPQDITVSVNWWRSCFFELDIWLKKCQNCKLFVYGVGEAYEIISGYSSLKKSQIYCGFDDNPKRASFVADFSVYQPDLGIVSSVDAGALLITFNPNDDLLFEVEKLGIPVFALGKGEIC